MMKSVIASALALVAISQPLFAAENIADLRKKAARGEGQLQSVGMPDSWANWKDTWQQLGSIYGIKHQDTDMSSAQEIAKFAAEKANATADIGDVGGAFGPVAVKQGSPSLQTLHLGRHSQLGQGCGRPLDAGLYRHHRLPLINKDLVRPPPPAGNPAGWRLQGDPG